MTGLRVTLRGDDAQLGRVPVGDVARLVQRLEIAAARAATSVLHQPKTTTGRYRSAIEQAVHFRLRGIETGSVVLELELPEAPFDSDASLDLEDPQLGRLALESLFAQAEQPSDPYVAEALLDVADQMAIGEKYDAVDLALTQRGSAERHASVDSRVRQNLRDYVESDGSPDQREDDVSGVLFEANFERRTAQLRTAAEGSVEVSFDEDHADAIQTALRQRSTLRGEVTYDPTHNTVRRVRLEEIVYGAEQLALDPHDFWRERSFDELAAQQSSGRPVDPVELYDDEASDEERDAFMAVIVGLE